MDNKRSDESLKIEETFEVTPIARTRTMNEIIDSSKDNLLPQVDPSLHCLRSCAQKVMTDEGDVVVTMIQRTRTMNEIIESNAAIMQQIPDDSVRFLRSTKSKKSNEENGNSESRPIKRTRTMNDVINSNISEETFSLDSESHNLRSSKENSTKSDSNGGEIRTQPLSRTKTMTEIMSSNDLDLYQYLNEADHYLRSIKQNQSQAGPNSSTVNSEEVSEPGIKRTNTMNKIIEHNKDELGIFPNMNSTSPSLRTRTSSNSRVGKSIELARLNEEYIDMQVQFHEIRRKELASLLGVLTKSKLSHKRMMQESNDTLTDITALGEGSSHMAKKLELFRWLNRASVNRCQVLIREVVEMDKDLQDKLEKVEDLLSLPSCQTMESSQIDSQDVPLQSKDMCIDETPKK